MVRNQGFIMKPVFKDYSIVIGIWIDTVKNKEPPDMELLNDLWLIRDIINNDADHKKYKDRLLKRVRSMKKKPETDGLKKLLEAHYANR